MNHFKPVPEAREVACSLEKGIWLMVSFAYWDQVLVHWKKDFG
jgi:hypothetical protein